MLCYNWLIIATRLLYTLAEDTVFRATFYIQVTCPNCCYGTPLNSYINTRSPIACSELCSRIPECQSWLYNPDTNTCRINAKKLTKPNLSCPRLILYGETQNTQPDSNEEPLTSALLSDHLHACANCCYGTPIETYNDIKSHVDCEEMCFKEPVCRSYLYNLDKFLCQTNEMPPTTTTSTCSGPPGFEGTVIQNKMNEEEDDVLNDDSNGGSVVSDGSGGSGDKPDDEL